MPTLTSTPLLAPWLLVVLSLLGAVLLRHRSLWLRLLLSIGAAVLLTFAMRPLVGSPLAPVFAAEADAFTLVSAKLSVAAWWVLVARMTILTGQLVLRIDRQHHAARLASDLAAGTIYLGTLLAVVDLAFGVSVTGLVATSGIIAIVLGLALQNTLGDLFSGIAIGVDRPYTIGDLIWIEGSIEGRVVETNWRSTRIRTAGDDIATVPNSVVAKSRILNRSSPTENRNESIRIVLDPTVLPLRGLALLRRAILTCEPLAAADPAPSIICSDVRGDGIVYDLSFSAPISTMGQVRSSLLHQIARHAHYDGVALATQNGAPLVRPPAPDAVQLLADVAVLHALGPADREALAARLIRHEGEVGHEIFTQGLVTAALYIVASGAFEVRRHDEHGTQRLGVIGPGDYFGEIALLTGAANAASVTALSSFVVYELTKDAMGPVIDRNPPLLRAVEEGARRAQTRLDRIVAAQACPDAAPAHRLLDRIKSFFGAEADRTTTDSHTT